MMKYIISADVIITISSSIIEDGSIVVQDNRIIDYGTRNEILKKWNLDEKKYNGILLPGLVNAHTHLQYTNFIEIGNMQHENYEEWSHAFGVMWWKKENDDRKKVCLEGIDMSIKAGVTTICDISTSPEIIDILKKANMNGCSFIEVMGYTFDEWKNGERENFINLLEKHIKEVNDDFYIGISPHATYSLDTEVHKDLVNIAKDYNLRLHVHVAEAATEDEFCLRGTGALADMTDRTWPGFDIINKGENLTAVGYTDFVGELGPLSHIAHGIYVNKEDRDLLKRTKTYVALCPRSNVTIGLNEPPVAAYLNENSYIAVGTDSLSSCPSLDLLEDVKKLKEIAIKQGYSNGDLYSRLLSIATIEGSKCLGIKDVGSIEIGKKANFAIFDVDMNDKNYEKTLVETGSGNCIATFINGKEIYRR